MARAIEMLTGVEFKSDYDTDKKKTTWILKSLSSVEFLECTCGGSIDHAEFVHKGLTGWKNYKDSKGKIVEFSEDAIPTIPPNILLDISLEVQGISTLTEKERKNLS